MKIIHWIGIDDHADKWTIAHFRENEDKPAREFELVPITDPNKQAALDRLRRERSTRQDRRMLNKTGKRPSQSRGRRGQV